jgi:hypothetical protein
MTWASRLVLLVVALGLVAMHHLVAGHQHSMPDPTGLATADTAMTVAPNQSTSVLGAAASAERPDHASAVNEAAGPTRIVPGAHASPGPAALLHQHPDGHGMSMSMHMCLAVLAAVALLMALVLIAAGWRPTPRRSRPHVALVSGSRAPPGPRRLAELQVLRV